MIPKMIHYCWYGNKEKPVKFQKYMKTWRKMGGGYEVIEWNETNCDLQCNNYIKKAVEYKNWAFVSDYFRLRALYEFGGIYLDTDVEVYKSFDDLLNKKGFVGYMHDALIGTAVLGFEKENLFIKKLLDLYDNAEWIEGKYDLFRIKFENGDNYLCSANNSVFTWAVFHFYNDFKLNGNYQETEDFSIFPKTEFEIGTFWGKRSHCVHRCESSWKPKNGKKELYKVVKNMVKHIPIIHMDAIIRYFSYKKHMQRSVFYERYLHDTASI